MVSDSQEIKHDSQEIKHEKSSKESVEIWRKIFGLPQIGGVTNGGLRGVWSPFPEIGRNRPFSPFFCRFHPFPEGGKSIWEIEKTEERGLFPQISSDLLKPPSLKPPFVALQNLGQNFEKFGELSFCTCPDLMC